MCDAGMVRRFLGRERIGAALRGALVCVSILSVTEAIPLAMSSVHVRPRCGNSCPRCLCRRHSLPAGLRAPCPCCSSRQGGDGISPLPPAVLPDLTRTDAPIPWVDLGVGPTSRGPAFARDIPHPPPRALLFS